MRTLATPVALIALILATVAGGHTVFESGLEDDSVLADGFEIVLNVPVANAGPDRDVAVNDPQTLDGTASQGGAVQTLVFRWRLVARPEGSAAELREPDSAFPALLPDVAGMYQVELIVNNGRQDSAPDALRIRAFNNFGIDSDGDGLGDAVELSLGLDPYSEDSFGDGIRDADRDLDNDGLTIRQELLLGLDPIAADSDGDGVNDGVEDFDLDGLNNVEEFQAATNPVRVDTDGDGWVDGLEVIYGSNPLSASVIPVIRSFASRSDIFVDVVRQPGNSEDITLDAAVTLPVLPTRDLDRSTQIHLGTPPVAITRNPP